MYRGGISTTKKEKNDEDKESVEIGITQRFGIHFSDEDFEYFLLSMVEISEDPEAIVRRIRLLPHLLDRIMPETEVTRKTSARLLFGIERIVNALRKILEIEDYDILGEIKNMLKDAIQEEMPDREELKSEELEEISGHILERISGGFASILFRLQMHEDPEIRKAVETLCTIPQLLDIGDEDIDMILMEDMEIPKLEEAEKAGKKLTVKRKKKAG